MNDGRLRCARYAVRCAATMVILLIQNVWTLNADSVRIPYIVPAWKPAHQCSSRRLESLVIHIVYVLSSTIDTRAQDAALGSPPNVVLLCMARWHGSASLQVALPKRIRSTKDALFIHASERASMAHAYETKRKHDCNSPRCLKANSDIAWYLFAIEM